MSYIKPGTYHLSTGLNGMPYAEFSKREKELMDREDEAERLWMAAGRAMSELVKSNGYTFAGIQEEFARLRAEYNAATRKRGAAKGALTRFRQAYHGRYAVVTDAQIDAKIRQARREERWNRRKEA